MDFVQISEEQRVLLDSVDKLIENRIKPLWKDYNNTPIPKSVAHEILGELSQLGFIGGSAPEDVGGFGLSQTMMGLLYERLAKAFPGLAGLTFITSSSATRIAVDGTDVHRDAYLEKLMSGQMIACAAITEPNVGSSPANIQTTAKRHDDGGWVINGEKSWISNGDISDICTAIVRTGEGKGGLSRFIVERTDGYTTQDIPKMAMNEWPTSNVHFNQVYVPAWRQIGDEGAGLSSTLIAFQTARCYVATLSLGIAQAALECAIEYAKEREQWGKRIGQHQMIQEMLADMATMVDAARLLTFRGFYLVDQGVRCDVQTSMAKAYATEMAVKVASMAVQIHGAYGISKEYPVERYFREARILPIPDGTTQIQKLIIGRGLTGLPAF
ncbi:MAG: acyl-CoA/acyl-ACP dehydrogenase [Gammaproteobacteria bacterium]|nr:acyl-CoA/acyl-ACP dehydrogenase [Gammaproteobacteria bacterium]